MNSNKSKMSSKRGFTLIELLVVVLIIGILAAVAVPQYQKAVLKSKGVQAKAALERVIHAEKIYRLQNGQYTCVFAELDISFPVSTSAYTLGFDCWNQMVSANVANNAATLVFYFNGRRDCRAQKSSKGKGDLLCQSLGYTRYPKEDNIYVNMYH